MCQQSITFNTWEHLLTCGALNYMRKWSQSLLARMTCAYQEDYDFQIGSDYRRAFSNHRWFAVRMRNRMVYREKYIYSLDMVVLYKIARRITYVANCHVVWYTIELGRFYYHFGFLHCYSSVLGHRGIAG